MVHFNNLNNGYNQCSQMYDLASGEGARIVNSLNDVIRSWKADWIGSDAAVNIADLIKVSTGLGRIVSLSAQGCSMAGNKVTEYQKTRSRNLGDTTVGAELPTRAIDFTFETAPETTDEQFVNVTSANTDLTELNNLHKSYTSFVSKFNAIAAEFKENWVEGDGKSDYDTAKSMIDEKNEEYEGYFTSVSSNLQNAISNWSQLQ